MSPSAVSHAIRTLERQGGVSLLHRSTRKLALTEAGERYYTHCKRLMEAARAAAESLQQARDVPTGELRVSAPVGFADHIAPALAPLLDETPQLRLRLLVDDAMIDLIDARIDLAIRIGRLADSTWIARKLCDFEVILCASPDYLSRHGVSAAPQDLAAHQWLAFGRDGAVGVTPDGSAPSGHPMLATSPRGAFTHAVSGPAAMPLDMRSATGERHRLRIASNNQVSLQLCEHGLGIAHLAHVDVLPALRRGALVRVLPHWRFGSMPVWAVSPKRDEGEAAKVRAAITGLKRHFATLPSLARTLED